MDFTQPLTSAEIGVLVNVAAVLMVALIAMVVYAVLVARRNVEADYYCRACDEQLVWSAAGYETTADGFRDCEATASGAHRVAVTR